MITFVIANLATTLLTFDTDVQSEEFFIIIMFASTFNGVSGYTFSKTLYHIASIQLEYQEESSMVIYTPRSEVSNSVRISNDTTVSLDEFLLETNMSIEHISR